MKTHVIRIKNMVESWNDVHTARQAVTVATPFGRLSLINELLQQYNITTLYDLVNGELVITREWTAEGWNAYKAVGDINVSIYADAGLEVSETVS
jgi:hypothetical protein